MPAATRVPSRRVELPLDDVKVGLDPRSRFWNDLGALVNYVRGVGSVLVPAHCPLITKTSGSESLLYRVRPSGRAVTRVWVVKIRAGATPSASATVAADGETARSVVASAYTTEGDGIVVLASGTATKTEAESTLTLTVTWVSGTVIIDSVECWELPRAQLTKDATDLGIDLGSLEPDRPILDRDYESVGAIDAALQPANGRRCGLMSWWGPTATFTTADTLFESAVRIVPPKVGRSDTTRTCDWNVYARVTNGTTTGRVRVVRRDGTASAWVNITSTSFGWITGTHAFECEDMADAEGIPAGGFETVNFELERTAGAGSIEVTGANVFDGTTGW
jgi:hypothetical protein